MEEEMKTYKPFEMSKDFNITNNPYGINSNLITQLANRKKILMGTIIASIVLSFISLILTLTHSPKYEYSSYSSSFSSINTFLSIVGFLIGLGISIAFIIFLNKSSQAFNSFNQSGDIRDLNDGFYHQNRYFNLTKVLIIIALVLIGLSLIISILGSISR